MGMCCVAGTFPPVSLPDKPFSDEIIFFLEGLSQALLVNAEMRQYDDIIAFAFWCRKSNIGKMKKKWSANENRLGLGTIFHIAPSNVPMLFAYSLVAGLLAGNINIVRLSSRSHATSAAFCRFLRDFLQRREYKPISEKIAIVVYEHNDVFTKDLSANCDGRVIWGSNETVKMIRALTLNPLAMEIVFPDRYSIALLDSAFLCNCRDDDLEQLSRRFYNDTYRMDQNACSSPKLIFWLPSDNIDLVSAKHRWWQSVYTVAQEEYDLSPIKVSIKYNELCQLAIEHREISNVQQYENLLYVATLSEIKAPLSSYNGHCGFFFEYVLNDLAEISTYTDERSVQTLVYAGVDPDIIRNLIVKKRMQGIDRIVPMGQSLVFDLVWDGKNIINLLSREITVQ